ncbi:Serine/threonine protein kinase [Kickxella alabastrina]|uniref:Serine/threonine protein kinase n=1 Tax=Kickxella alabastrina TaxID=61397 RepID=A0ACC1IQW4_9FUNG|nr:Serine/threonine protein kinase [Kickxella alabastrina]
MPITANTCTTPVSPRQKSGAMLNQSIDNGNLQFVKLIGVGTYGEVYRIIDRRTNEAYAVKVLPRKHAPETLQTQQQQGAPISEEPIIEARLLSREVSLYSRIPPHNNIVRLERMLHTPDQLFMVMENCPGGDLYNNISNNPYFHLPGNDALIRRLFLQLVSAVEHCHTHGVYHRDIKPENVLVTQDFLNVKLIDFGLSTSNPWCGEIGCGSAYYMSPECQGGINNNLDCYAAAPNDVWALGIILINLTTGRNPWNRAHSSDALFRRYLTEKSFLCQAIRATPHFEHIIHRVLDINPITRCTLQELRQLVQSCPRFVEAPANNHAQQASPAYVVHPANDEHFAVTRKREYHVQQTAAGIAAALPNTNNGMMSAGVAQQCQEITGPSLQMRLHQYQHHKQHRPAPTDSMSFSSTDSIYELFSTTNKLMGYPPFCIPGMGKTGDTVGSIAINKTTASPAISCCSNDFVCAAAHGF